MGIFKSLFGRKIEKNQLKVEIKTTQPSEIVFPQKSVSTNAQNLILIAVSEKYKVDETKFPNYFRTSYGIGFPGERLKKISAEGYIRFASAAESISNLKATELKEIASQYGLPASGKKDELCMRIVDNIDPKLLDRIITDRYWRITDTGHALLEQNPYIDFYLQKHAYSLDEIGMGLNELERLLSGIPKARMRNRLWSEFNRKTQELYKKGISTANMHEYSTLLRVMALFLEEEGRNIDALATYIRYLHYSSNFNAGLQTLKMYSFNKDLRDATDRLYMYAEMLPFMANDIIRMSNKCGFDSGKLKDFISEILSKEQDTGIFSQQEMVELLMRGLDGDTAGQKDICEKAIKKAAKKLPRK